jgi:hypothetical protein
MKSSKRILFSVFFLILSLFSEGARTYTSGNILAAGKGGLSPGEYLGTFHFTTREIAVISMKSSSLSWDVKDNRLLDVDGDVRISVTSPNKGIIYINPTNYLIYDIRDISAIGSKVKCKLTGYMKIEAPITFISALMNNYNPKNGSFSSTFMIEGWRVQYFKNLVDSNQPACTQQVNERTLEALVQNFFNQLNKNSPMIFNVLENSDTFLKGNVYTDNYDKTTEVKGGWTQRELRGSWFVSKQPVKNDGWKQ